MATPVTEDDLLAFVDDELPPERRIEVEAYLQGNPALASRVMQDLRQRDKLRLYLMTEPDSGAAPEASAVVPLDTEHPPPSLRRSATRRMLMLRRAAAALILIGVGWTAHTLVDPVAAAHPIPVFADEAVEAHRAAMDTGPSFNGLPPEEAPRLAQVVSRLVGSQLPLPSFPGQLMPLASRIVPWDEGSAVQVVYMTQDFERVTLFAAEGKEFAVTAPTMADVQGLSVVYWQQGTHVYALCASIPADQLLDVANTTQTSWF
ncbi:anti-sigma factor RsiW [Azospirillum sp. OGB3]|uniref:anti-sigma factor family protein n=1 Tax=Azospirillum sp. OGB3 TaxID=2587012 RepID=UPI0016066993|nr:anti-sigma factor [Azospirillum sp. OGB3]MBB3268495.1 anti-sigma factor RsiW [Azospirillum sp. OGB3]